MARVCLGLSLLLCAAVVASCVDDLDIPPAPDFEDVLQAYANPNAEVSTAIMAVVGEELLNLREQLLESDVFDEILEVIIQVQVELDENTDDDGNLFIPGIGAFPEPNAVIELDHRCSGWDPDSADADPEANGSIELTMVLKLGDISPVVWGEATQCQFLTSVGQRVLESSYDGEIAVHLGEEPLSTSEPIRNLVITFVLSGALNVNGKLLPVQRSFRLRGEGWLDILWELENGRNFVYLFNLNDFSQGIRDANCTGETGCSCDLEERQCTLPSGNISW